MSRRILSLSVTALLFVGSSIHAQPSFPQGNGSMEGHTGTDSSPQAWFPPSGDAALQPEFNEPATNEAPAAPAYGSGDYGYESGYYGLQGDNVPADAALINLTVPRNAEVWFSGEKTSSTGRSRSYVTPPLESNRRLAYDVRVRWMENGQPVERVEKVRVHPGDRLSLHID